MNGNHTERLSQEDECREKGKSGILESASAFAQGVLEGIEKLAGTTACKSVQLVKLRQWVKEQGASLLTACSFVTSSTVALRMRHKCSTSQIGTKNRPVLQKKLNPTDIIAFESQKKTRHYSVRRSDECAKE